MKESTGYLKNTSVAKKNSPKDIEHIEKCLSLLLLQYRSFSVTIHILQRCNTSFLSEFFHSFRGRKSREPNCVSDMLDFQSTVREEISLDPPWIPLPGSN